MVEFFVYLGTEGLVQHFFGAMVAKRAFGLVFLALFTTVVFLGRDPLYSFQLNEYMKGNP